jgi:hypothetical protein
LPKELNHTQKAEKLINRLSEETAQLDPQGKEPKAPPQEKAKKEPSEPKKSPAELLLNLVEDTAAGFFHSTIKELYATIPVDNHVEVLPLHSGTFEIWLNSLFYRGHGKPISKDAIKQVIGVLSAKALFDNPDPVKLSVRVAEHCPARCERKGY